MRLQTLNVEAKVEQTLEGVNFPSEIMLCIRDVTYKPLPAHSPASAEQASGYHDNASHRVSNSPLHVKNILNFKHDNIKVLAINLIFMCFIKDRGIGGIVPLQVYIVRH